MPPLWQIEILPRPGNSDPQANALRAEIRSLGIGGIDRVEWIPVYLVETDADRPRMEAVARTVLIDEILQTPRVHPAAEPAFDDRPAGARVVSVFRKPGVMDPVEASARKAFADAGLQASRVRTGRIIRLHGAPREIDVDVIARKLLANEAVDQVFLEEPRIRTLAHGAPAAFEMKRVAVRDLDGPALETVSARGGLSLTRREMEAIRDHFRAAGRDPSDVELEVIAQTWSEHCKHKTFTGPIRFGDETIGNLLKETIVRVTETLARPWCLSVFKDNAGIVAFDDELAVAFKVETHNHPSAIEPYGGASTGLGGVIRDCLGCGLGAKPIVSTDVFCVAPPDTPAERVPKGAIPPRRLLGGVVAGVRDYGNRMGIPTVNGAVFFDERYIGNPLVFCGTVGVIPRDRIAKGARTGDRIVVVGGRTGRDGIHGATFSSVPLTHESETLSGGAVQIGNAITEKMLLDVQLQARDRGLYAAVTDCGAGGLSSAVGEMGEETGALVDLDRVPLKYDGLTYVEIWISESQERMVFAVAPEKLSGFLALCRSENVEATDIGEFTADRRMRLRCRGTDVMDLDMEFLHHGLPKAVKTARWTPPASREPDLPPTADWGGTLRRLLGAWNVCSKEWIIRRYDHEVQGRSVLKPLQGAAYDGPGDAAVVRPRHGSDRGIAVACGMAPRYGDLSPAAAAAAAIDEACRNVVAVGGDPERIAILDNFAWGNPDREEPLGALVLAARACRDVAIAYGTPFISGKDSFYNEFRTERGFVSVPHSLLISALTIVPDVRKCVSMDLKRPGSRVYLVGLTKNELGGSEFYALHGQIGANVPQVDPSAGPRTLRAVAAAIREGLVLSCHDLSEGGLGVAAAEAAFAGETGLRLDLAKVPGAKDLARDEAALFSESASRFLVEVDPARAAAFEKAVAGVPTAAIGETVAEKIFEVRGLSGKTLLRESLAALKEAWQAPMRW